MTIDKVIDGILDREKGFMIDAHSKQPTMWGIQADEWGRYNGWPRAATADEMKKITREQATEYYRKVWVGNSPFTVISYEPLRVQMMDFAVNSGTERAIRWLQRALGFDESIVTGQLDDRTRKTLLLYPGPLVNKAVAATRACMMMRTAQQVTEDKQYERGWLERAIGFVDIPRLS